MIFCQDRYASIGTGWPMTIDERDVSLAPDLKKLFSSSQIMTNLPVSEEAFARSQPEQATPLAEAMKGDGASKLSSFGGVILLACLFGRNLIHLHRPNSDDRDHDLHGDFWKRHRELDNTLLQISLSLPSHLRLPHGLHDPNIIFCNLNIHTSTICLHQAAIFKADKNEMSRQISAESKRRCIVAADQITNIMKMASHLDLSLVRMARIMLLSVINVFPVEPIHILLLLRFRSSLCPVSKVQETGFDRKIFITVPSCCHDSAKSEESVDRVLPYTIGC